MFDVGALSSIVPKKGAASRRCTYVEEQGAGAQGRDAPENLLGRDGAAARGRRRVSPMPVGSGVGGVMVRRARRPLDDGVARAGRAVVAPVLARRAVVVARRGRLEVLRLVAAARAAAQEVRAPAAAQEVRAAATGAAAPAPATYAPLQLLQLRAVVLRCARHCWRPRRPPENTNIIPILHVKLVTKLTFSISNGCAQKNFYLILF